MENGLLTRERQVVLPGLANGIADLASSTWNDIEKGASALANRPLETVGNYVSDHAQDLVAGAAIALLLPRGRLANTLVTAWSLHGFASATATAVYSAADPHCNIAKIRNAFSQDISHEGSSFLSSLPMTYIGAKVSHIGALTAFGADISLPEFLRANGPNVHDRLRTNISAAASELTSKAVSSADMIQQKFDHLFIPGRSFRPCYATEGPVNNWHAMLPGEHSSITSSNTQSQLGTIVDLDALKQRAVDAFSNKQFDLAEKYVTELRDQRWADASPERKMLDTQSLGVCKRELGKHDEAAQLFKDCLDMTSNHEELAPHKTRLRTQLAETYRRHEKWDLAAPQYASVLDSVAPYPNSIHTRSFLKGYKQALEGTGKYADAQKINARLVALDTTLPEDLTELREQTQPPGAYRVPNDVLRKSQSANYNGIFREPLPNGFVDNGTTGFDSSIIDENGEIRRNGMLTVVDLERDRVLQKLHQLAGEKFGHLESNPELLATALTEFSNKVFNTSDLSGSKLEDWYKGFREEHEGHMMWLGDFAALGRGVCSQRALFLKSLGDQMGLNFVVKDGLCDGVGHKFCTLDVNGEERIYDPTQGIYGDLAKDHPEYESMFFSGTWD
jgi:tetratricopeptide (TPR) repeat protein